MTKMTSQQSSSQQLPEVSFIITFYNKAVFIPRVLQAVFAQKGLGECEYIFVDDGSTDESLELLRKHSQGQKNVNIIHQENAGPALATNRGIEAATTPYIKFVDGDDILHPRATIELVNGIRETGAEFAFSLGEPVLTNSEKMDAPDIDLPDLPTEIYPFALEAMIKKALFNLTCVLVTTNAAKGVGGCDPRVFIQDYSIALRLATRSELAYVPKVLHWTTIDVENRASELGGGAQVLHDLNLALAYFVADHPDLPQKLKAKIIKRTTGRAWKWARRMGRQSLLSKHFARYLRASLFPHVGNAVDLILSTCEAFRSTSDVRSCAPEEASRAHAQGVRTAHTDTEMEKNDVFKS